MPKVALTADMRRVNRFNRLYKTYKATFGLTEDDVAERVGLSRRGLLNQRAKLTSSTQGMRVGVLLPIMATWGDDDILKFVRGL